MKDIENSEYLNCPFIRLYSYQITYSLLQVFKHQYMLPDNFAKIYSVIFFENIKNVCFYILNIK